MLNAWQSIVGHTPESKNEVENEIIWNSKFVTIARKSVFYRSWYEAEMCSRARSHMISTGDNKRNQRCFLCLEEEHSGKKWLIR